MYCLRRVHVFNNHIGGQAISLNSEAFFKKKKKKKATLKSCHTQKVQICNSFSWLYVFCGLPPPRELCASTINTKNVSTEVNSGIFSLQRQNFMLRGSIGSSQITDKQFLWRILACYFSQQYFPKHLLAYSRNFRNDCCIESNKKLCRHKVLKTFRTKDILRMSSWAFCLSQASVNGKSMFIPWVLFARKKKKKTNKPFPKCA